MLQSRGRRLLLLGPLRMILAGASCLLNAPWPRLRLAAAPRPLAGLHLSASLPFLGLLGRRGVFVAGAPHLVGCCLAPPCVPWLCGCGAGSQDLRHPAAVVARHLVLCRGCDRRRASVVCLLARRWCPAPSPVRSLSVLWYAFPSPWRLSPARGLSPPALLIGCAGHAEAG